MKLAPEIPLGEAKALLRERFKSGEATDCPCCGQLVKLYRRKLTSSMALGLIALARWDLAHPNEFVHLETYLMKQNLPMAVRGDVAKLRFWGLIELKQALRDDNSPRNGYHRITDHGRDFIYGIVAVRSHVLTYNQQVLGFSGAELGIREALGEKFNYEELMRG